MQHNLPELPLINVENAGSILSVILVPMQDPVSTIKSRNQGYCFYLAGDIQHSHNNEIEAAFQGMLLLVLPFFRHGYLRPGQFLMRQ